MVWNYRVVVDGHGRFRIHEVFYQKNNGTQPYAMSKEPAVVCGDTRQELIDTLEMMLRDAKKRRPVFVPPKRWDKRRKK